MRSFQDVKDQTWELAITVGAIKRVRAHFPDVDLMKPGPEIWDRLGSDLIFACDLVYVLVKPEADRQGISDVEFGERLAGDGIILAVNALLQEWTDFFQRTERAAATIGATTKRPPPKAPKPKTSTPGTRSTALPESSASTPNI